MQKVQCQIISNKQTENKQNNCQQKRMKIGSHKFKIKTKCEQAVSQIQDQINQLSLMTKNLLKIKKQLTQPAQQIKDDYQKSFINQSLNQKRFNEIQFLKSKSYYKKIKASQNSHKISLRQNLINQYQKYLSENKFSKNFQIKINELLDQQQGLSIGNSIALFQIVFYFRQVLTEQVLIQIQNKAFKKLIQIYKNNQFQMLKTCLIELIAICKLQSRQIISFFVQYLLQNPNQIENVIKVLLNMNIIGIGTLIKIVDQDFQQVSNQILHYLCQNQIIIKYILVPILVNDLLTKNNKSRNIALTILNRLGSLIFSQKLLQIFLSLFKNNSIDKKLLISTIYRVGNEQGINILINLLEKSSLNQQIAVLIVQVLSEQSEQNKDININILPVENSLISFNQINKIYYFEGAIQTKCQAQSFSETLYLNSGSLITLLQDFISNEEIFNQNLVDSKKQLQYQQGFILTTIIKTNDQNQKANKFRIISKLSQFLNKKDQKYKLKQAIIQAFSIFQIDQNHNEIIDKICINLWSSQSSIKSAACITLSKLKFVPSFKIQKRFAQLLRDNYWKVRISVCQAIGCLVNYPSEIIIENLIKNLKDGSINRQLICRTMLKMHQLCVSILITILNETKDEKIQQAILCSFNYVKILQSMNFGQVMDALFKFSKHRRIQIRYICLEVVNELVEQSLKNNIQINYFKPKNILPFLFNFLDDKSLKIRQQALKRIIQFGSYAQLILIEGITKGKPNCKIQCAKGLAMRGIQNFRALILGIRDTNNKVQKQCIKSILQNFTIEDIVNQYKQNSTQCISLIYNIKDLLEQRKNFDGQIIQFLESTIDCLIEQNQIFDQTLNQQIQNQMKQYKQSIKMRKNNDQIVQTNYNDQNIENIDPNIKKYVHINKKKKNYKDGEEYCEENLNKNNIKQSEGKRYYFKFNQPQNNQHFMI